MLTERTSLRLSLEDLERVSLIRNDLAKKHVFVDALEFSTSRIFRMLLKDYCQRKRLRNRITDDQKQ